MAVNTFVRKAVIGARPMQSGKAIETAGRPLPARWRGQVQAWRRTIAFVGLAALVCAALVAVQSFRPTTHRTIARPVTEASDASPAPSTPPPAVEPVANTPVSRADAVVYNAAIPFSTRDNPAAKRFVFAGSDVDKARSTDCLAAAAYYEAAGEGEQGMRAVAQVVLNRLRHPAFPKTVCGVVFEGSERSSGCQFTFTCDGSMARLPSAAGWKSARKIAADALTGKVFAPIGWSTHYHTNWVVPAWSGTLDKTAGVGTHLFYRWMGWWGTPGAFRGRYAGAEPAETLLAGLSPDHATALAAAGTPAAGTPGTSTSLTGAPASVKPVPASKPREVYKLGDGPTDPIIVILDPTASADSYAALALSVCGAKDYCKLLAWRDARHAPGLLPVQLSHMATMSFSYLRDRSQKFEKALWNCTEMPRADARQCIRV